MERLVQTELGSLFRRIPTLQTRHLVTGKRRKSDPCRYVSAAPQYRGYVLALICRRSAECFHLRHRDPKR